MDMLGVAARLNTVSADACVQWLSDVVVDQWLLGGSPGGDGSPMSLPRRLLLTWFFTYFGGLGLYYLMATADYLLVFFALRRWTMPDYTPDWPSVRREVLYSTRSLAVMSGLTTPMEVAIQLGYSRVYHDPAAYGWAYLLASPVLFLLFTDTVIYWVHRGLHHRSLYKHIHKPHHSFVHTTPYAAFAFHPLDGYLQGVAYQAFVFVFSFSSGGAHGEPRVCVPVDNQHPRPGERRLAGRQRRAPPHGAPPDVQGQLWAVLYVLGLGVWHVP
eukprot:TRINITY_DN1991_c0_g1_i5.p1 TRINITY_DN1991_c0_g1~~TRINITY_DN1991_c0_g1_i5.p1  ORF type:complete len:295 (+),score=85.20 TRINITY_DN1991_c0_g1_i5:74-886(+)